MIGNRIRIFDRSVSGFDRIKEPEIISTNVFTILTALNEGKIPFIQYAL